jgi:hypothetical protein
MAQPGAETLLARQAPELAYDTSALIALSRDAEGLQSADPHSNAYQVHPDNAEKSTMEISGRDTERAVALTGSGRSSSRRNRRRAVIAAISATIALLVGFGAGIGVGHATGSRRASTPTSAATSLASGATATAATTTSAVTSGATGIAAFSCNSTSSNMYTSASGRGGQPTTFIEDCYTDYFTGPQTLSNGTSVNVTNVESITAYSFQGCMDECVQYNGKLQVDVVACQAVTYYANLSASIPESGANCWLLDSRGNRHNGDLTANYALAASAYLDFGS